MSTIYKENYKPLVIRDNYLFVKGNLKGYETQGSETGVSEYVGANNNPGALADVPAVIAIAHNFGEATQPGNIRSIDVEVLMNFNGTTNITSGQSIAGIRGCVSVASVTTFTSSGNAYLYGVQGKAVIQGTVNTNAGFVSGLFGQCDTSGASCVVTSGYISALQLDMGATSILTSSAYVNAATVLNTTQCLINSVMKVIANATYFMDLSESNLTGNWIVASAVGGSQNKKLKCLVGGTAYYIPLNTA